MMGLVQLFYFQIFWLVVCLTLRSCVYLVASFEACGFSFYRDSQCVEEPSKKNPLFRKIVASVSRCLFFMAANTASQLIQFCSLSSQSAYAFAEATA